MTDLQHEMVPATAPVEHHRSTLNWWLAGGLVVALLAVIGLGAWVYYDHQPTAGLTASQAAAVTAVDANFAAMAAQDATALKNSMTDDVVWTAYGAGTIAAGPYVGDAYLSFIQGLWPDFQMISLGDPVVGGDTVVAVPTRISGYVAGGGSSDGVTVFTVRNVGGTDKVAEVVWIPQPSDR